MEKVYVNVDYQVLVGGAIKPVRIYWHDGRAFDIRKTLHCCTSEDEYEGIRYTVLIGSAEKYIYRVNHEWYVIALTGGVAITIWNRSVSTITMQALICV